MYRLLTRGEVALMLAAHGATYKYDYEPGSECWMTSWGMEFSLTPEDNGLYHEFMVISAERVSLSPNRPRK